MELGGKIWGFENFGKMSEFKHSNCLNTIWKKGKHNYMVNFAKKKIVRNSKFQHQQKLILRSNSSKQSVAKQVSSFIIIIIFLRKKFVASPRLPEAKYVGAIVIFLSNEERDHHLAWIRPETNTHTCWVPNFHSKIVAKTSSPRDFILLSPHGKKERIIWIVLGTFWPMEDEMQPIRSLKHPPREGKKSYKSLR